MVSRGSTSRFWRYGCCRTWGSSRLHPPLLGERSILVTFPHCSLVVKYRRLAVSNSLKEQATISTLMRTLAHSNGMQDGPRRGVSSAVILVVVVVVVSVLVAAMGYYVALNRRSTLPRQTSVSSSSARQSAASSTATYVSSSSAASSSTTSTAGSTSSTTFTSSTKSAGSATTSTTLQADCTTGSPSQLVRNGNFGDGSMSCWTETGSDFQVENTTAYPGDRYAVGDNYTGNSYGSFNGIATPCGTVGTGTLCQFFSPKTNNFPRYIVPGSNDTFSFSLYHPSNPISIGESVALCVNGPHGSININYIVGGTNSSLGFTYYINDTNTQVYSFVIHGLPFDRWSVITRNPYNDLKALGYAPGNSIEAGYYYAAIYVHSPGLAEKTTRISMYYDSFSILAYGPTSLPFAPAALGSDFPPLS